MEWTHRKQTYNHSRPTHQNVPKKFREAWDTEQSMSWHWRSKRAFPCGKNYKKRGYSKCYNKNIDNFRNKQEVETESFNHPLLDPMESDCIFARKCNTSHASPRVDPFLMEKVWKKKGSKQWTTEIRNQHDKHKLQWYVAFLFCLFKTSSFP